MLNHLIALSKFVMPKFAEGAHDLLFMECYSVLFGVFAIGAPTLILRYVYLETTKPKVRALLLCCMAAVYVLTVLWLADLFCYAAVDVEQVKLAWTAALLGGTLWTALMALILWFCRPKRQLTEEDKMKLKDI